MNNNRVIVRLLLISTIQIGWLIFSITKPDEVSLVNPGDFLFILLFVFFINSVWLTDLLNIEYIPDHKSLTSFGHSYTKGVLIRFFYFLKRGGAVIVLFNPIFLLTSGLFNDLNVYTYISILLFSIISGISIIVLWDICVVNSFREVLIVPYIPFFIFSILQKFLEIEFLNQQLLTRNILIISSIGAIICVILVTLGFRRFERNWF